MSHEVAEQREFHMGWAVTVSVSAHVLMLVVTWLFPPRAAEPEAAPQAKVLRFTFTPPTERDVDARPRGEVPLPTPPTPVSEPRQTSPQADPQAVMLPPAREETAAPETQDDLRKRETRDRRSVEPATRLKDGGLERRGETDRAEPSRTPSPPSTFDMERALREFRSAMNQPAPEASPEDRRGREGRNVPRLPQLPTTGFGFGNLEFESRDYDWSDYARQIYVAIWRAWHQRLYVTSDVFERWGHEQSSWLLAHGSRVRFTIERTGQVSGIVLETPSGCYPLDDSALDALEEVILPPLPDDFPRDRETVHGRFLAEGDVRAMRRQLGYLKRMGFF